MIEQTASSVTYAGGDGQTVFPIPFPFLDGSHIAADRIAGDGSATGLTAGVDYAVSGSSGLDGELTLTDGPLASDEHLRIRRLVPLTQEIVFHNQGPNSPEAMEHAADKLTMIAQQLRDGLDGAVPLPDGMDGPAAAAVLAGADAAIAGLQDATASLRTELAGKADGNHGHGIDDIAALAGTLDTKASTEHGHDLAAVAGLVDALAGKVDADDPRLEPTAPPAHAALHSQGGEDPVRPEDIGAVLPPPADGKTYLATAGGWVEYIATGGEGGTSDHTDLINRDVDNQHPQSAISGLSEDLAAIRAALAETSALPAGGAADDLLAWTGTEPVWRPSADVAATLPIMTDALPGVARLAPDRGLAVDGEGRLGVADANLVEREAVDAALLALAELQAALGPLARAEDAPADGLPYARQDGGWQAITASDGGGGGGSGGGEALIGEIRLLPHRQSELPAGWYFCNGDRYAVGTPQAAVLASLSDTLRSDWGIIDDGTGLSLPNLFTDGRGCFPRPVDNSSRFPGQVEDDAIRNITGTIGVRDAGMIWYLLSTADITTDGAFTPGEFTKSVSWNTTTIGTNRTADILFDASRVVPTAAENRPLSVGMTPAIYLGV
ncbi:MAG: hypothetical protein LIP77_09185 [Planctomycetes bacterium]|nr:hypothetical protein [Planctomycetota bacterium]